MIMEIRSKRGVSVAFLMERRGQYFGLVSSFLFILSLIATAL